MKNIRYEILMTLQELLSKHGPEVVLENTLQVCADMGGDVQLKSQRHVKKTAKAGYATGKGGEFYEHFKCSQRIKDLCGHAGQRGIETAPYKKFCSAPSYKKETLQTMLAAEEELRRKLGKPRIYQSDREIVK